MSSPLWHLTPPEARLESGKLRATLDVSRPWDGLGGLRFGTEPIEGRILQVEYPQATPAAGRSPPEPPADTYHRGSDLIVTYGQTEARPYRSQIYWRAAPPGECGVELVASVQTSLLDSHPAVVVRTGLAPGPLLHLESPDKDRFRPLPAEERQTLSADRGPGCFLLRLPGDRLSYAEMIHPSDFTQTEIFGRPGEMPEWGHLLFGRFLEKGVILRARVRARFLPREGDTAAASAQYREFCGESLPLTT